MQMSKFNYAKQFGKREVELSKEGAEVVNEPIGTPVDVKPVDELPKPMMEITPEKETTKVGVVSRCKKLNVRKGPSKQTNVAAVIDEGREVTIEEELTDWYKVRIAGGIIGYCMAEFISVK